MGVSRGLFQIERSDHQGWRSREAPPYHRVERRLCGVYFARFHKVGAAVGRPSEGAGTLYFNSSPVTETLVLF
jgi:hypothetical protein